MKTCIGKEGRRNLFFGASLLVLGIALSLASCSDFFSTSWGEDFARDPSNVRVTTSNVNELLKDANGDTEASRAILKKLKGTTNPTLQAAAVKAANQAAGLTTLVVSNLDTLTKDTSDTDALERVAKTVLGEAKKNDITGVAGDIAETLAPTIEYTPEGPTFKTGSFVSSVSNSDLTLLLVTMMMAEASDAYEDFDAYAATWENKNINSNTLQGNEMVIAAIANEVINRPNSGELGNMLKHLVREDN
jgi:hypothetical protein